MARRGSCFTAQLASQQHYDVGKAGGADKEKRLSKWSSVKETLSTTNPDKNAAVEEETDSVTREHIRMAKRLKMIMPDDPRLALWDNCVLVVCFWTVRAGREPAVGVARAQMALVPAAHRPCSNLPHNPVESRSAAAGCVYAPLRQQRVSQPCTGCSAM